MGWKIRVIIVALTALMIALLIASIPSLVTPEFEDVALLIVATFGVNLLLGLLALFRFSGKRV